MKAHLFSKGFAFPLDILSAEECRILLSRIESLERYGCDFSKEFHYQLHVAFDWFFDLCFHPRLLQILNYLFDTEYVLWNTAIFMREPASQDLMLPHQDSFGDGLLTQEKYTLYLTLTDHYKEKGGLYFYPESHKSGRLNHKVSENSNNIHGDRRIVCVDFSNINRAFLSLAPGQASIHHMDTVHGSAENKTSERRVSLAFRFISVETKIRGESQFGVYYKSQRNPSIRSTLRPCSDFKKNYKVYQKSTDLLRENYLFNNFLC